MSTPGEAVCLSRYLVHSGYMSKQGRVFKTWKKRYFQLYNDGTLTYKHDAECENDKLGEINVKCAAIESDGKCIKISTSSRTLFLKCSTTYEAQVWTGGLTRSSTQNLTVSGDQGIFIELTWQMQDTKQFLEHEKVICENVARNFVHAITFLAWPVSDGQDRRWTCIFSSRETLSKVFSSVMMNSCISHGRISRCNVGGKVCASLFAQHQGQQHFLESCGIRNCRVEDVPVVREEPTATCFILNPLASFLPSKGILYRLAYSGSKESLEVIAQIQSSLAYVARADYPGVLCYHCYRDELPDCSTILHILQLYANNGVMETFFRDDQVKRLHANMKKFSSTIKQIDAVCWYDGIVAPRNSFLPRQCSRQVCNNIGEAFRTSEGFCLHSAPAFPANMKRAVGWIRKRRRKQDPWKLRFFIVNPDGTNLMRYYLDPGRDLKGKGERGSFSLENLVIYLHGGARSAMLTLSSSKEPQTMTLNMRTSAEYFRWLQDLTSYAGTVYNLDHEHVIVGQKPKNKMDTFNIDNLAVSAIALQLDQLTTGLNDTGASHRSGHSRCVTETDLSDHRVRKWCMAYTSELNTIMAMEDTAVADTIIWFQRKLVKYFKKHFNIEERRRMQSVTEEIVRSLYENAKEMKKIVRRRTSTSFKDWLEKEYSADPNETFSDTCSRHADSVRFFIECVYEMLKDDHAEILNRYYEELRELYNTRDEEEVDDLHIMTTVIAVERRVLNPIYDYVEFFVTCTDNASSVDTKITLLREELRKVCNNGGFTIEDAFEAVPSESGWNRSVQLLNTLETLRQPAEMLSRFMAVMMSMTETYLAEEKIRNPEVNQPDPLGADDIVPILLAIVTRCNLKKTQTIFQMMSNVGSAYISTGRTKYYLTMFESVLYYLTNKGEKLLSDLNARNIKSAKNDISRDRSSVMLSYEEDLSFGHLNQEVRIKQMLDHLEERIECLDGRIYAVQRLMRLNQASLVLMSGRRRRRKSNFFGGAVVQTEKILPTHTAIKNS